MIVSIIYRTGMILVSQKVYQPVPSDIKYWKTKYQLAIDQSDTSSFSDW